MSCERATQANSRRKIWFGFSFVKATGSAQRRKTERKGRAAVMEFGDDDDDEFMNCTVKSPLLLFYCLVWLFSIYSLGLFCFCLGFFFVLFVCFFLYRSGCLHRSVLISLKVRWMWWLEQRPGGGLGLRGNTAESLILTCMKTVQFIHNKNIFKKSFHQPPTLKMSSEQDNKK